MKNFKKIFNPDKLSTLLLYTSILTFIIAFNFEHNPPSGWYQQFMPDLNGRVISDITFVDSLVGYTVTPYTVQNDTAFILKTTTGGNNWSIIRTETNKSNGFNSIQFINPNTGFASGETGLLKTTNAGENWVVISNPTSIFLYSGMWVLSEDTIWVTDYIDIDGGLFRTTNGGLNWEAKYRMTFNNPKKIYMYNGDLGFMYIGNQLYRTSNSGVNWAAVSGGPFTDIYFADSLTGWKALQQTPVIKKTTDGGMNWEDQILPQGGNINSTTVYRFSNISKDTLWGVGGRILFPNNTLRGIAYRTTNGGENWLYQIPDTSIGVFRYIFCTFLNKNIGWIYSGFPENGGAHTVTGGDTTFTKIAIKNNQIPENFTLNQNYPNPFNPKTIISYKLRVSSYINIKIYNALGKEFFVLVNQKQNSGDYKIEFDGSSLSSGVYFYSMFLEGVRVDTKKMILVR